MNPGDDRPGWRRILIAARNGGVYEPMESQRNRVHMANFTPRGRGAVATGSFPRQVGPDVRSMVEAGLLVRMPDRTYKPTELGLAMIDDPGHQATVK